MKVVDTRTLKRLLQNARNHRLNRLLPGDLERLLDSDGKHVLSHALLHGDGQCIRCFEVLLKVRDSDEPISTCLDFVIQDFNQLHEHGDQN